MANEHDQDDDYKPEGTEGAVTIEFDDKDDVQFVDAEKPQKQEAVDGEEAEHEEEGEHAEADGEKKPREKKRWLTTKEKKAREKAARERDKARIEYLESQLAAVNTQVAEIQGNFRGLNEQSIDKDINAAANAYHAAKAEISRKAQAGEDFADDLERMQAARDRHRDLSVMKERATKAPQQQQPSPANGAAIVKAQQWMARNSWFRAPVAGQAASDTDSEVALAIDKQLKREGWNASTDEYYAELDKRLKRYAPHLYDDEGEEPEAPRQQKQRGGPNVGGGVRQANGGANGKSFTFTPDQLKAMKMGGIDTSDPKVLKEYAKEYMKHAKEQAARGRRIMAH